MTPKMYLDRYTYLSIPSPFDGMLLNCGLTGYGSGWNFRNGKAGAGIAIQHEYAVFRDALRKAHHGNALTPCGPQFYFSEKPLARISRLEEFYSDSLVRAYVGKGSPDEITDALRLALALGRIGLASVWGVTRVSLRVTARQVGLGTRRGLLRLHVRLSQFGRETVDRIVFHSIHPSATTRAGTGEIPGCSRCSRARGYAAAGPASNHYAG